MKLSSNIFGCILILFLFLLSSCSTDDKEQELESIDEMVTFNLKISSLTRNDDNNKPEIIKSLRIILTDKYGKVKANFLEYFDNVSTNDFSTNINLETSLGKNTVYVIANEEPITDFNLDVETSSPLSPTLTEELNKFVKGNSGFEDFISSIYFTPDYSESIPMSSKYEIDVKESNELHEVYLVNIATKIKIVINNYRNDPVELVKVNIDKLADKSYLMANIDEDNLYMKGLYWIDWMKEVAEDTNLHPDLNNGSQSNDAVNDKWGWLTEYYLPSTVTHSTKELISGNQTWTVPKGESQIAGSPEPGIFETGFFYFPESKYILSDTQSYSIEFEINLPDGTTKTISKDLGNIKTMFRNTYALIKVEMNSSSEDIYAEILKWGVHDTVYGTISPE